MVPTRDARRATWRFPLALALTMACLFTNGCLNAPETAGPATLAVVNARAWTGVPDRPWAEAVAVRGNLIEAVGSDDEIRALVGAETRVVDAAGGMVCPGFIDAHVHLLESGLHLFAVQLRDAKTPEEFTARIGAYAEGLEPGAWITGGDWNHELWGGELPHRDWIDRVTPKHPVFVARLDGHMALANGAALKLAGISRSTPEVPGGRIVRDEDGQPTGILKDNAMPLVQRVIPDPSEARIDRAVGAAMAYVAERGVTSVHAMGSGGWDHLEAFWRARKTGRQITRIFAAVPISSWKRLAQVVREKGTGDAWVRIGALKGFVDGSLGSHTAAFHEGYTDTPKKSGLMVNSEEALETWISAADAAGLQCVVHAIGDRAISILLDIYERVARRNGPRDRRFRIEHAQHVAPGDLSRFRELDVIASMQPYHAIDDGCWAEKVIGPERIKTTYAFRSLLDEEASVAFGSDWFVAPPSPLLGIYAAVTRRTLDGRNPQGWVPEQKISVEEALRAYTVTAARASFEEDLKGSLEPGKLADLVILDRDLTRIPAHTIKDVAVVMTIVDGRIVYTRQ